MFINAQFSLHSITKIATSRNHSTIFLVIATRLREYSIHSERKNWDDLSHCPAFVTAVSNWPTRTMIRHSREQGIGNRVAAYDLDQVGCCVGLSAVHVGVVVHLLLGSNAFTANGGVVGWTADRTSIDGRP